MRRSRRHHPFALPDDDDHEAEDAFVFGSGERERALSPTHLHDVELALDGGFMLTIAEVDEAHPRGSSVGDCRNELPLEAPSSCFSTPAEELSTS